jgi:plastocyanin
VYFTAAALITALIGCTPHPLQDLNPQTPASPTQVVIYDYKFYPTTLTVPVGTEVTWLNKDIAPHTVTHRSYGDEPFDSESMGHLATFTHTFHTAGSYSYLCVWHQGMQGTVVVQ